MPPENRESLDDISLKRERDRSFSELSVRLETLSRQLREYRLKLPDALSLTDLRNLFVLAKEEMDQFIAIETENDRRK